MRLHRSEDRNVNCALHLTAVIGLRFDARTIDYIQQYPRGAIATQEWSGDLLALNLRTSLVGPGLVNRFA